MSRNIFAYTKSTTNYPAYVSVNRNEDASVTIWVRDDGSQTASRIDLTAEQARALGEALCR